MQWESATRDRFDRMTAKIPVFHRRITQESVIRRAEELAQKRRSLQVEEKDVIGAFFCDVPSPFYGMMIRLLDQSGFDYRKYGYPRNSVGSQRMESEK